MKPLDPFASCNPRAVELARAGNVKEGARLYAHGGALAGVYLSRDTLNKRAIGYASERQLAANDFEQVFGTHHKARRIALDTWQFVKACRKEGLL